MPKSKGGIVVLPTWYVTYYDDNEGTDVDGLRVAATDRGVAVNRAITIWESKGVDLLDDIAVKVWAIEPTYV